MTRGRLVPLTFALGVLAAPLSAQAGPAEAVEGPKTEASVAADADATDLELAASGANDAAPDKPPRVDGAYFGMVIWGGAITARLQTLTPAPVYGGGGGSLRLGGALYPWMTLGFDAAGGVYLASGQTLLQGGLMVNAGFYPMPGRPLRPLSIQIGLGFGAGAVIDDEGNTDGYGIPRFMAGLRYEFFPGVDRRRPDRGGGFSIGPELAWRGFTPNGPDAPMTNLVLLGVGGRFYWGR